MCTCEYPYLYAGFIYSFEGEMHWKAKNTICSIRLVYVIALLTTGIIIFVTMAVSPFSLSIVGSKSMNPTLNEGDILLWMPVEMNEITVGDIVIYKSYTCWPDEKMIVHRVVEIRYDGNGCVLLGTRGDANSWVDQERPHLSEPYIHNDHIVGKVVCFGSQPVKIPFVGMIGLWF